MQVEVNEQNIILYHLVELTGNSAEEMLIKAREAFANGYTLTCEVPEPDGVKYANTFDIFGGGAHSPEQPWEGMPVVEETHPLQHGIDEFAQERKEWLAAHPGIGVVVGEVISSKDEGDTSHIPFPPDMVPFDDED